MTRFARIRRRPDHWSSDHERARARAAERLDGPLGLVESTWLEEHLVACPDCAAAATAYDADRLLLRGLRDDRPEPPRDLWARTAAAIERESTARGRTPAPAAHSGGRRIPLGVLSGVAVIAVVVGVSAVSSGFLGGTDGSVALQGSGSPAPEVGNGSTDVTAGGAVTESAEALATPLAVGAGSVKWLRTEPDGAFAFNAAPVHEVCPIGGDAECATLDDGVGSRLDLAANPKTIIGSPSQDQAVVVSDDGQGGERITVVDLPIDRDVEIPDVTASATPSQTAAATPAASPGPTEEPSSAPSTEPTSTPSETPAETASASPTSVPPTVSPEPTVAASLAIAQGIRLVGESAAFSADGSWFAFTAAAIDGSSGPDVYLWRVGDETARRLTTGGMSTFASWDGTTVLVSRISAMGDTTVGGATPPPLRVMAETVAVDPATGTETAAGTWWRPIVDPKGDHAVAWVGTITTTPDPAVTVPDEGRLELRSWPPTDEAAAEDGSQVVVEGVAADFDVRWDETGEWFAVWVTDPSGAEIGRLSLFRVDPASGQLLHPDGAPVEVPAMAGFSIGDGRLAWVTPPGQDGEGSRVQVVAWSPDGVGSVETAPGEDVIVVR